jgi:hypothetical protein
VLTVTVTIAKHLQADSSQMPTTFEREFCGSIAAQLRHPPSAKQAAVLHRIFVDRFGGSIS